MRAAYNTSDPGKAMKAAYLLNNKEKIRAVKAAYNKTDQGKTVTAACHAAYNNSDLAKASWAAIKEKTKRHVRERIQHPQHPQQQQQLQLYNERPLRTYIHNSHNITMPANVLLRTHIHNSNNNNQLHLIDMQIHRCTPSSSNNNNTTVEHHLQLHMN